MKDGGYDVPADIAAQLFEWLHSDRGALQATIDITPEPPPERDNWPRVVRRWASKRPG